MRPEFNELIKISENKGFILHGRRIHFYLKSTHPNSEKLSAKMVYQLRLLVQGRCCESSVPKKLATLVYNNQHPKSLAKIRMRPSNNPLEGMFVIMLRFKKFLSDFKNI